MEKEEVPEKGENKQQRRHNEKKRNRLGNGQSDKLQKGQTVKMRGRHRMIEG